MDRPHHQVSEVVLVDEQTGFGGSGEPQLDGVPADRGRRDRAPANGPEISIRSMSLFQSGWVVTSDQRRQIDPGDDAVVSRLWSVSHITHLLTGTIAKILSIR